MAESVADRSLEDITIAMFCIGCLYPLEHLRSRCCPECGRHFDPGVPASYLPSPPHLSPFLGARLTLVLASWARRYKWIRILLLGIIHVVLRGGGAGFIATIFLIDMFDVPAGRAHIYMTAAAMLALSVLGFFFSHSLASVLRVATVRDPIRGWSYVAGLLLAVGLYVAPLLPP